MQYEILADPSWRILQELVDIKLKGGWKLQGGIAMAMNEHGVFIYAQAIIFEKK